MTRKGEIDGVKFQIVENNVIEEQNSISSTRKKQLDGLVTGYINAGISNGYDPRAGYKATSKIDAPEFAAILKDLNDRDSWKGKPLSSGEKMYVWSELAEARGVFQTHKQAYVGGRYTPDIHGMNPSHVDHFAGGLLKAQSYEHTMPYVRDPFHGFGEGKFTQNEGFNAMGNWRWEDAKKRVDKHEDKFLGGSEGDRQASYFAIKTFHKYRDTRENEPGARFDAFADAYLKDMLAPGVKPANMSKFLPPDIDGSWPPKRASEDSGMTALANNPQPSMSVNDRALLGAANEGVRQALTVVPNAAAEFTPEAKELAAFRLAAAMKHGGLGTDYTHAFLGGANNEKNVMLAYGDPNAPQTHVLHARLYDAKQQEQAVQLLPAAKDSLFESAAQKPANAPPDVIADARQIETKGVKLG